MHGDAFLTSLSELLFCFTYFFALTPPNPGQKSPPLHCPPGKPPPRTRSSAVLPVPSPRTGFGRQKTGMPITSSTAVLPSAEAEAVPSSCFRNRWVCRPHPRDYCWVSTPPSQMEARSFSSPLKATSLLA